MTRQAVLVAAVPLAVGAAVALPVALLRGPGQWRWAAVGFGLCVPVGVGVVLLAAYLNRASPYGRVLAVFVGTFARLVVGFGGGAVVFLLAGPDDKADRIAFWLWLLFAYLVTLAVETAVLARPDKAAGLLTADGTKGGGHGG